MSYGIEDQQFIRSQVSEIYTTVIGWSIDR